jgi:hypothetical protein
MKYTRWYPKGLAVASQQCTISHFHFTRKFFTKNNMTVVTNPPYFSLFPRVKIKLKVCHLDNSEVIEAELQVAMNTLTEHDFQDAFKKWPKCWEWCIRAEGDYFEDDGG